ncbi:MAG: HAD family hydrolase [Candidatus Asgardarchaeia archaeon]
MIKAVIFDFDGTLVDSVDVIVEAFYLTAKKRGFSVKREDIRKWVGTSGPTIVSKVLGIRDKSFQESFLKECRSKMDELIFEKGWGKVTPNAIETIKELRKRGLKVGVGSGTPKKRLEMFLRHFGILKELDTFAGSDEVKNPKPSPELFILVAERLGVDPKDCLIVGDSVYDVKAGKAMGAKTILLIRDENKGLEVKPDFLVTDLKEVLKILDEITR